MRAGCWEALRKSLMKSCTNLDAVLKFKKLKLNPVLERFADPIALLDLVAARNGDAVENNRIYALLLEVANAGGDTANLAVSLLWLGLWVGLDAIYRRRLKRFPQAADELVSEISHHFIEVVKRADLARIERISATLVMNTDRLVLEQLQRGWSRDNRLRETRREVAAAHYRRQQPHVSVLQELAIVASTVNPQEPSAFGISASATPDEQVAALRQEAIRLVGRDGELVVDVEVEGVPQSEIADRRGIPRPTLRQRVHRARQQMRERLVTHCRADRVSWESTRRR